MSVIRVIGVYFPTKTYVVGTEKNCPNDSEHLCF